MRRAALHRSRNDIYLLSFFALLAAGAIALAAVEHAKTATTSRTTAASSPYVSGAGYNSPQPPRSISAERQNAVEAEIIALRPTGFEPSEIIRPGGRFLLAVSDQSGLEGGELQLLEEGERKIHEVRLSPGKRLWRKVVDLAPGEYRLTEASHPEWVCRITITR
jgi:hypothetical protein